MTLFEFEPISSRLGRSSSMTLANFIGSNLLTHNNARVCAPPGVPTSNGNRSIVVATPMRSGTHLAIDLILNSLPAYRRKPLYIDLDMFDPGEGRESSELGRAGYVIKTHFPSSRHHWKSEDIERIARESVLVVVRRPVDDVRRSLERWLAEDPDLLSLRRQLDHLEEEIDAFQRFWMKMSPYIVEFRHLFDTQRCWQMVADLSKLTNSRARKGRSAPVPLSRPALVHLNKALTRLVGRHAPRIDTTIRALR